MRNNSPTAAMPANSETVVAKFAISSTSIAKNVTLTPKFSRIRRGQTFAGDGSHAGAHLLYNDQPDRDDGHAPEQLIPIIRAGLGIGGNAAGIVTRRGGDYPRPEDRKQDEQKGTPPGSRGWLGGGRRGSPAGAPPGAASFRLREDRAARAGSCVKF